MVFHDSSVHVTIVSKPTNHKPYYTNQYRKHSSLVRPIVS